MKRAVIVVGSHYSGKSKTINKYLKKMFGISERARIFHIDGERGLVKSQSLEESRGDLEDLLDKCSEFRYVVLACRPTGERPSYQARVEKGLSKMKFNVSVVEVEEGQPEKYYRSKAEDAFAALRGRRV
jgi:nicotinamide riboside kinase